MYGVRYVTIAKLCDLTGYTPAGVYTRKSKGIWLEGTVWKYEPGTKKILIDLQAFEQYVESGTALAGDRIGTPMRSPTLPNLSGPSGARRVYASPRPQFDPPEPRRRRQKE